MESNERLARIAEYVKSRLVHAAAENPAPENDPVYRWQHTLRVANYGKVVAEQEGARVELVIAACLLHDIAHFDSGDARDHGRVGAEKARPLLVELNYSPEEVENICYSIASHVDVSELETLEAKVVSDADNIDRFGAYRIFQWCQYELGDYDELVEKLSRRLEKLEEFRRAGPPLETQAGIQLFNRQLDLQIAFFEALLAERKLTVMPDLN